MVARRRLEELAARKQILVAGGELQRALIGVRAARIHAAIPFIGTAERLFRSRRSWMPLAAAVVGLLVAWRSRRLPRIVRSGILLWPLLRGCLKPAGDRPG